MVRKLILVLTLIFSISNPKSTFRQIWVKEVKIIVYDFNSTQSLTLLQFGALCTLYCIQLVIFYIEIVILSKKKSKLFFVLLEIWQSISRTLVQNQFSGFSIINPFLGKFGLKKSKLFVFLKIGTHTHTHIHTVSRGY